MNTTDPKTIKLVYVLISIGAVGCALAGVILLFRNLPLGLAFCCLGLFGSIFGAKARKAYKETQEKDDR